MKVIHQFIRNTIKQSIQLLSKKKKNMSNNKGRKKPKNKTKGKEGR